MSGYLESTIKAVRRVDEDRPRSQQRTLGISELGGCRAAIGYRLDQAWESDDTDTWGAIRGTALHTVIFDARKADNPRLEHEVTVVWEGIPGHVDEYDPDEESVTDVKTTRLANSIAWRHDVEALAEKRVQVQTYARALVEAGWPVKIVRLLIAPVDGRFTDWWEHVEPYDPAVSDAALTRLRDVEATKAKGEYPPRDKPYSWCESWCSFFTLCRGGMESTDEPITDPELASAIEAYGQATATEGGARRDKKALADLIRGLKGTARGYRIGMTNPSGTKDVPDLDRIAADYTHNGLKLPTREVPTSTPSLTVKKIKEAK